MKRYFLAGIFALATLLMTAGNSQAGGWVAGRPTGYGWLGQKVYSCAPGIHQHGPLYNYTPLQGDYTWMQFHWWQLYNYHPAYGMYPPSIGCGNGCGGGGCGAGGCSGGAFSHLFGCGLQSGGCNSSSCGGSSWSSLFHGASFGGIFHKTSPCSTGSCGSTTPATPCTSCVKQTSYSAIYPEYLSPSWR